MREHVSQSKKATTASFSIPSLKHRIPGFGLDSPQASPQAVPLVQPLHKPLTHDISRIPLRNPQAKLSISQPGDKYEQEADSVAQQVMQRMAQPINRQSIQRVALPEGEELQMKPMANSIRPLQRQEMPEDEEELQMKSLDNSTLQRQEVPEDDEELQMKPMVQRQAGMDAAPDLEASINQARGGGQAMADNIRQPMEVAFGADFSGVKVHTDGQSDQLNRSIQARAFTTGQDVFFRQGEYNPGSRGGQELIAHELTHVVQQNGGAVQRSRAENPRPDAGRNQTFTTEHHIIPHNVLIEFANLVDDNKNPSKIGGNAIKLMASAMPNWETVRVDELIRINALTDQLDWAIVGLTRLDAETALKVATEAQKLLAPLMPGKNTKDARVVHEIHNLSFHVKDGRLPAEVGGTTWSALGIDDKSVKTVYEFFTKVNRGGNYAHHLGIARTNYQNAVRNKEEAEADAATPYYEWFPGNLFTGPDGGTRSNDPHEGFDDEAYWFLTKDHFAALKESYELIRAALDAKTNKKIKQARTKLEATFKTFSKKHGASETSGQWKKRFNHQWVHKERFKDPTGQELYPTSF